MNDQKAGFTAPSSTPELGTREFSFTNNDFERVRKLIYDYAGISLSTTKQDMAYSRLARRLRETRTKSFDEYLTKVERGDKIELENFVNALTTNLTSFFREPHHFPLLAEKLKKCQGRSPIKIWCSAASTGEEPYSIAMTVVETFNTYSTPVSILASDLDTNVLSIARKGTYPQDRIDKISPERLNRFFVKGVGIDAGTFTVRPELRRMIEFTRINLLAPNWPVPNSLDVIFCRNVMIYFDKPTQYKILSRFAPLMDAQGLLFAGHSESFLHAADIFRSPGKTVYEPIRK